MNSRQRVYAALRRQPTDRPPIFMWFHPDTAARLARELEIPAGSVAEVMGNDIRQAWVGNNQAMEGVTHEHDGETHSDAWGVEWVKEGPFNQIKRSPLEHAGEREILRYQFPAARIPSLLGPMEPLRRFAETSFIGCDVSPCLFEMICRLRGMENAILDLADPSDAGRALLTRAGAFAEALAAAACNRFHPDWLWTGDDVGSQQSLIMSPVCWRELIRGPLARIFQVGKVRGLFVAYHSCGAIRPIIPDLIEIGLDVLNPIQCNCPGMDPRELKREFGKRLAFMGGVDTQELLPRGSAEDVRRATEHLLEGMTADGGGYILAASHTIPPETPLANIFALYAAAGIGEAAIRDHAADLRRRR
ncbi:MAG: methyltransferase [Kiritimatiellae bacterium]|nr:methyltransferase [Kiritimatiellia bacterium]